MPRHTSPLPRRLAPFRRAAATAGLTAAALVVGVGGYTVATSPALAAAPGDRFAVSDLLGGGDTTDQLDTDAVRRDDEQASRSARGALAPGLPATSAQAQSWVDEVGELEAVIAAETAAAEEAARVAAEEEAARVAAEEEAARVAEEEEAARAAAEEVARVAAEEEAARVAAEEEAARVAEEEEAARAAAEEVARVAAEEEAARVAAEEEAARVADEEEAEREAAEEEAERQVVSADPGSNRAIAQSLLGSYGWGGDQWSCLDNLWEKESNWNHTAANPSSSAYGIPQSLPGSKMASAGSDWETNPETQIRWGLGYIEDRYGSPCSAWEHSRANNWY
ncbi:hypothetical protein [Aquipuribacter sp. MA13-13]|uniref:aggregation-promoting factor C-terminal-like domain-containing protein n=1 Tax=Aquipuribacter sp. MA13-13 TaxID=3440840 RepID=UPI003EE8C6DF